MKTLAIILVSIAIIFVSCNTKEKEVNYSSEKQQKIEPFKTIKIKNHLTYEEGRALRYGGLTLEIEEFVYDQNLIRFEQIEDNWDTTVLLNYMSQMRLKADSILEAILSQDTIPMEFFNKINIYASSRECMLSLNNMLKNDRVQIITPDKTFDMTLIINSEEMKKVNIRCCEKFYKIYVKRGKKVFVGEKNNYW